MVESANSNNTAPGGELEQIPVDELIAMTREFTRRITNQDRQRLGLDLRESGHSRSLQISAPITLQQFFSGDIDLDTDLARRFLNAPLLSNVRFMKSIAQPGQKQESAQFSTNDDSFFLTIDAHLDTQQAATLEFTFTMFSALALRFRLSPLVDSDRTRWLDLMARDSGIAFLWTRERWEQPYLIFVVREHFARLYAFSPHGAEAAARLTPDMINKLIDWIAGFWYPDRIAPRTEEKMRQLEDTTSEARGWDVPVPAQDRPQLALKSLIPHAPEEQWDDDTHPEPARRDFGDDFVEDTSDHQIDHESDPESDLSADDLEW